MNMNAKGRPGRATFQKLVLNYSIWSPGPPLSFYFGGPPFSFFFFSGPSFWPKRKGSGSIFNKNLQRGLGGFSLVSNPGEETAE